MPLKINTKTFVDNRYLTYERRRPRGVVANVLDYDIIVSEFKLHSRDYIHFWANTLGEGRNLSPTPGYGLNITNTVLL